MCNSILNGDPGMNCMASFFGGKLRLTSFLRMSCRGLQNGVMSGRNHHWFLRGAGRLFRDNRPMFNQSLFSWAASHSTLQTPFPVGLRRGNAHPTPRRRENALVKHSPFAVVFPLSTGKRGSSSPLTMERIKMTTSWLKLHCNSNCWTSFTNSMLLCFPHLF